MMKINNIVAIAILMQVSGFVFGMDHGDVCMSALYYKTVAVEKYEGLNHKPFSDVDKKVEFFVIRGQLYYSLKSLSSDKFEKLKAQR